MVYNPIVVDYNLHMGGCKNGWLIEKIPLKWMIWGYPHLWKPRCYYNPNGFYGTPHMFFVSVLWQDKGHGANIVLGGVRGGSCVLKYIGYFTVDNQ